MFKTHFRSQYDKTVKLEQGSRTKGKECKVPFLRKALAFYTKLPKIINSFRICHTIWIKPSTEFGTLDYDVDLPQINILEHNSENLYTEFEAGFS